MAYISRPLPRDLLDEQVVEALDLALAANPNPAYLVETLPAALQQVTGRDLQVLDRSVRDVTGRLQQGQVMIRDGDVGHWPGYDAMRYPLLAPPRGRGGRAPRSSAADAACPTSERAPAGARSPAGRPPPPPDRR